MGHAFDLQARLAVIKQQAESQTRRFQTIGALHPTSGSSALTVHSAHCYLRVLRASSSSICAEILALRCCGQMIAEALMRRRRLRCSKRFNPWNQAYRNRLAPPCRSTSTRRNDFAFLALPEGGVETLLASPVEAVWPSFSTGQNHCAGSLMPQHSDYDFLAVPG
jgi:hypothetical protein